MSNPLLDPPRGAPEWVPRVDDERSVSWLRRAVIVVLVLGLAGFVVRGADRPRDPGLLQPGAASNEPAPAGSAPPGTAPGVPDREPIGEFGEIAVAITDADGNVVGWCFLMAHTTELRQRGLMEVTDLQGYPGMVFVFQEDRVGEFYMRNTPMPLSIAFFDSEGKFVSSTDMEPCDDRDGCPLYGADAPYRFAIEMPKGQLDDIGIGPGSRMGLVGACAPRET